MSASDVGYLHSYTGNLLNAEHFEYINFLDIVDDRVAEYTYKVRTYKACPFNMFLDKIREEKSYEHNEIVMHGNIADKPIIAESSVLDENEDLIAYAKIMGIPLVKWNRQEGWIERIL